MVRECGGVSRNEIWPLLSGDILQRVILFLREYAEHDPLMRAAPNDEADTNEDDTPARELENMMNDLVDEIQHGIDVFNKILNVRWLPGLLYFNQQKTELTR